MPNGKTITKKQRAVIEDLFAGELDEQKILEKHKVSRRVYDKWLVDENFTEEFERRLKSAHRQSELIIARYAAIAAAKLVQLTESENQETARKACLDIINYLRPNPEPKPGNPEQAEAEHPTELAPELAGRLLAALASDRGRETSSA
jgi:predicted DNA-binding protein YlxM (UPF0122 family)